MKYAVIATLSFLLGIAITSVISVTLRKASEVQRISAVEMPTAAMIVVINNDLRAGRIEQAHAKLRVLEEKYLSFRAGGATPEMFYTEVNATDK